MVRMLASVVALFTLLLAPGCMALQCPNSWNSACFPGPPATYTQYLPPGWVPPETALVPPQFVPAAQPPCHRNYVQAGINLGGFFTAELGVGEVARRLAVAMRTASVPYATTTFAHTTNRTAIAFAPDTEARFDTNLVCVNADSWGAFAQQVGPAYFADRHTIAVWFWETSIFPSMLPACPDTPTSYSTLS